MSKERFFFFIFGAANLGLLLYGLLGLTLPGILLDTFSQRVYRFPAEADAAAGYLLALYRLLGFFNLLIGGANLFLLWRFRSDGQVWVARLVVSLSLLAYIGPIVFDNTVGSIGVFEIIENILFAAMLIAVGMCFKNRRIP